MQSCFGNFDAVDGSVRQAIRERRIQREECGWQQESIEYAGNMSVNRQHAETS